VPASPANNGYKPGFAAALMGEGLTLAQDAAPRRCRDATRQARAGDLQAFDAAGNAGSTFPELSSTFRGLAREVGLDIILRCELLRASKDDWLGAAALLRGRARARHLSDNGKAVARDDGGGVADKAQDDDFQEARAFLLEHRTITIPR